MNDALAVKANRATALTAVNTVLWTLPPYDRETFHSEQLLQNSRLPSVVD